MTDNDDVSDHFENVHGIRGGATRLLPFQEITVNEQLAFVIPKLADIENFGQEKKLEVVRGIFITCQSRGVLNNTNDKTEACLREARSKEFMLELSKACTPLFFSWVEKYITEKIKKRCHREFYL